MHSINTSRSHFWITRGLKDTKAHTYSLGVKLREYLYTSHCNTCSSLQFCLAAWYFLQEIESWSLTCSIQHNPHSSLKQTCRRKIVFNCYLMVLFSMTSADYHEWSLTNGLNGVRVQVAIFLRPTSEDSTASDKFHQALWESFLFLSSWGIGVLLLDLKTTPITFCTI